MPARLQIENYYAHVPTSFLALLDCIPEDKLDWSPAPQQWSLKGLLLHVAMAHHNWLATVIHDGEETPDVLRAGQTKTGLRNQLRLSSERLQRFLADPRKLAAEYRGEWEDLPQWTHSGHWIALQLLEHDIHHRAEIFQYLQLLGIEHPPFELLTFQPSDEPARAGAYAHVA